MCIHDGANVKGVAAWWVGLRVRAERRGGNVRLYTWNALWLTDWRGRTVHRMTRSAVQGIYTITHVGMTGEAFGKVIIKRGGAVIYRAYITLELSPPSWTLSGVNVMFHPCGHLQDQVKTGMKQNECTRSHSHHLASFRLLSYLCFSHRWVGSLHLTTDSRPRPASHTCGLMQ